ncbi:putative O-methyltransferase YrrM [Rhodovulum iodosum]|uniref:O-methyltransferase YrrM n=1 Tax=Rhodovulum iodosum TaxID=68291 RepID=A0ABV3XQJ5_9RHOB|nr:class I SAM-dependent methyltransferase [Rhodovulum robiginosum]RSK38001.1 class I SAM-dependent methyltransferase [Rhodovulum robiginosum]
MTYFDTVSRDLRELPYMKVAQARVLRDLIADEDAEDILEIGFFKGKSSAYIGAILEDRGAGHLVTIDRDSARNHRPDITQVLAGAGLGHRVTPVFAKRSYTWELQRLISADPSPRFDLCYFDGGHHWDGTGFGVLLVDMLLRPGGLLVLDDMNWSINGSPYYRKDPKRAEAFSEDECAAHTVRLVWDRILPHLGYRHVREIEPLAWGIARKPDGPQT